MSDFDMKICVRHKWQDWDRECPHCEDQRTERPAVPPQEAVDQSACSQETQPPSVVQGPTDGPDRKGLSDQSAAPVPQGYRKIQIDVWTDGRRFVILEQEAIQLIEDPDHSCDLSNCGRDHVIARLTIDGVTLRDKSDTAESQDANVVAAD